MRKSDYLSSLLADSPFLQEKSNIFFNSIKNPIFSGYNIFVLKYLFGLFNLINTNRKFNKSLLFSTFKFIKIMLLATNEVSRSSFCFLELNKSEFSTQNSRKFPLSSFHASFKNCTCPEILQICSYMLKFFNLR